MANGWVVCIPFPDREAAEHYAGLLARGNVAVRLATHVRHERDDGTLGPYLSIGEPESAPRGWDVAETSTEEA